MIIDIGFSHAVIQSLDTERPASDLPLLYSMMEWHVEYVKYVTELSD
jgi:hypothetical protein